MRPAKVVFVAVVVLALAGCGDDDDRGEKVERVCRSAHDATVCLERPGGVGPWRLTAQGFEPNSELSQQITGGSRPSKVRVGADGKFPTRGVSGGVVVPTGSITLTVSGTAASGEPVRFELSAGPKA